MNYLAVGDLSQLTMKERMRELVAAEYEKPVKRAEEILEEKKAWRLWAGVAVVLGLLGVGAWWLTR